jgi:23S rRNA pseudouridine1911/1915/1917 synthase
LSAERWTVAAEEAGQRLDRHLAARLDRPRNQVQRWIADGLVRVDGRPARPAQPLRAGETVECEPPPPAADPRIEPESGALAVLHQDPALVVLDKPPGLTVHPGAGRPDGTLVHRLLGRFPELAGVGGPGRPGIVHRLDKDTSGVMAIARTAEAYRALSRDFAARRVVKRYLAVVWGTPPRRALVDAPLGRHPQRRREMAVVTRGRPARTRLTTLATAAGVALVELDLETGRTHQIRVHLKSVGYPLVGDPVYGEKRWKGATGPAQRPLRDFPRPALHAWRLALHHPTTGDWVTYEAPVPEDLATLWREATGSDLPALPRAELTPPREPEDR